MIEEEIVFDKREISEIDEAQQGHKKTRKNYGNRYLLNRNTISVVDTLFKRLESIQRQKNFNTKGELMEYLVELDRIYNPQLETVFKCKKCGDKVEVLKDMNLDRIMHRDLCKTSPCNGSIVTRQIIMHPGTTTTKDEHNGTTEGTTEAPIEYDPELGDDGSKDITKWTERKRHLWSDGKVDDYGNIIE